MANYDMDALFHPKVEIKEKSFKNVGEYSPTADKGQNGIYKSIIRFVSWWQDPLHSYTEKWSCWLVDPVTNKGKMVDCPSTVGKPSPLQDMFFKLRKAESVQEQKKSEIFSRKQNFACVIQVIKDEQNRDAEGKLFVYKFGKKIFDKYEAEKKPVIGDEHEAFDLIDGKAFALVVTKVGGYNNYDQSKFLDKKIPLLLPVNKDGQVVPFGPDVAKLQPINERTPREVVFNFLKDNSPDLTKYGYKEWDQDIYEYVNQVITAVTGQVPSNSYADIRNNAGKNAPAPTQNQRPAPQTGITTSELSLDDLNSGNSIGSLPSLDLPELNSASDFGISGDLDDALGNL